LLVAEQAFAVSDFRSPKLLRSFKPNHWFLTYLSLPAQREFWGKYLLNTITDVGLITGKRCTLSFAAHAREVEVSKCRGNSCPSNCSINFYFDTPQLSRRGDSCFTGIPTNLPSAKHLDRMPYGCKSPLENYLGGCNISVCCIAAI